MKILVLSDSHSTLSFMRRAIGAVKPDAVVHLGDHYDDGAAMAEEFPGTVFHLVPGNCDHYRMVDQQPNVLCYEVCGVRLYMTHGHLHSVKTSLHRLLNDARNANASAVLYGHTHIADCRRDGALWVLNPGSCGYGRKSAGLLEVENGNILSCRIVDELDLEV